MAAPKFKLGELLIQAGLINQNQLIHALERQKLWGGKLGSNLVQMGFVKEDQLVSFLSQKLMIPSVNLQRGSISPEVLKVLSPEQVEKYCVLPLEIKGKTLSLAMVDPSDLTAISELQFATGLTIKPYVALETSIKSAIKRYYRSLEVIREPGIQDMDPIEVIESDTEMVLTHMDTQKTSSPPPLVLPEEAEEKPRAADFPVEAVLKAVVKLLIRKGVITYEELKEEVTKEKEAE